MRLDFNSGKLCFKISLFSSPSSLCRVISVLGRCTKLQNLRLRLQHRWYPGGPSTASTEMLTDLPASLDELHCSQVQFHPTETWNLPKLTNLRSLTLDMDVTSRSLQKANICFWTRRRAHSESRLLTITVK